MLQSILVVYEIRSNYELYAGMNLEDHVVPHTSSKEPNLSFPSPIPFTMQPCQANKQ